MRPTQVMDSETAKSHIRWIVDEAINCMDISNDEIKRIKIAMRVLELSTFDPETRTFEFCEGIDDVEAT